MTAGIIKDAQIAAAKDVTLNAKHGHAEGDRTSHVGHVHSEKNLSDSLADGNAGIALRDNADPNGSLGFTECVNCG
jgi:hypothetical protein